MKELLLWIYAINAIMLIVHEMDSAYQHEWKLFNLKGGVDGFLIIHIPLLGLIFWGFLEVYKFSFTGIIFLIALSIVGIGAFFIHRFFIKKGHKEFTSTVSQMILKSTLVISICQLALTINFIIKGGLT